VAPSDESWAACLIGDGDQVGPYSDRVDLSAYLLVNRYLVRRGLLSFDTSSLSGQFIRSIKLRIPVLWGYEDDEGFSDIYVTQGVFSDPIVMSDYQAQLPYTTKGGTFLFEDYTFGDWYLLIELNEDALGWINRAGVTKLCLRMAGDLDSLPAPEGSQYWALRVDTANPVKAECARLEVVTGSPGVTTDPATLIEGASAKLNGTLTNGGGESCNCCFEYGLTTDYGETTATQGKTTGDSFSRSITGLEANTEYHYRAKATSADTDVTGYGADRTFTTIGVPYPTKAITRVSGLIHRWRPGQYTLEMALGDVTADFGTMILSPMVAVPPTPLVPLPPIPTPPPPTPQAPWPLPTPPLPPPVGPEPYTPTYHWLRTYYFTLSALQVGYAEYKKWMAAAGKTPDTFEEYCRAVGRWDELKRLEHLANITPGI